MGTVALVGCASSGEIARPPRWEEASRACEAAARNELALLRAREYWIRVDLDHDGTLEEVRIEAQGSSGTDWLVGRDGDIPVASGPDQSETDLVQLGSRLELGEFGGRLYRVRYQPPANQLPAYVALNLPDGRAHVLCTFEQGAAGVAEYNPGLYPPPG